MKKLVIPFMSVALILLSSCANSPDSIKSNKHESDKTQVTFVPYDKIYDDFESAYSAGYSKFILPDSSTIKQTIPDGVYNLELAYSNANNSIEWKKDKVLELYSAFNFSFDPIIDADENIALLQVNSEKIKIEPYSRPYISWKESDNGVNSVSENITSKNSYYIDHINTNAIPDELNNASSKALSVCEQVNDILGDELEFQVSDGYIIHTSNDVGYEIELRKSYKGIGIQNLISEYSSDSLFVKGNTLMSFAMQTYIDLDSNFSPEYFVGCDAFTVAKADPLNEIISFKGACDILETELADNMSVKFDNVILMYEPRGTLVEAELSTDSQNIICTPKWYFIQDDVEQTGLHSINYITVDCASGAVEVIMP